MHPSLWNESKFEQYSTKKTLKFGYYFDDGVTIASPPVKRAVLETVQALQSQGHQVVLVSPPDMREAIRIFLGITSGEGYASYYHD